MIHRQAAPPQLRADPAVAVTASVFEEDLLDLRPHLDIRRYRLLLLQSAIKTRPAHTRQPAHALMRQHPTRALGELPQSLQRFRLCLESANVMELFIDAEPSQVMLPDGPPAQLVSATRPTERPAQAQPQGAALSP